MWTKENAIKTISCITATALAAGAIGVAYVNTTPGIDGIRLAGITAQEESDASVLMEEAEHHSHTGRNNRFRC